MENKNRGSKVMVGMSGGVDSSAAALLLLKQGFEVTGATFRLYDNDLLANEGLCGSSKDALDAKQVCDKIGIEHKIYDFKKLFEEKVIKKFEEEYYNGSTPNPCIDCNKYIKFLSLLDKANELGIDYIATGHYASVTKSGDRYLLTKPVDKAKDQTYVLYNLKADELKRIIFPLGEFTKNQIREFAAEYGFENANKPDSQDICFVPDGDYAAFLQTRRGEYPEGDFVDTMGNVIGRHKGMIKYTIGQRKGLGMGFGRPQYVLSKDPITNRVVLGDEVGLFSKKVMVTNINFSAFERLDSPLKCMGKLRYRHLEQPCTIFPIDENTILAEFDEPQRAVTKGQAAVFYDGNTLLGGGTIL